MAMHSAGRIIHGWLEKHDRTLNWLAEKVEMEQGTLWRWVYEAAEPSETSKTTVNALAKFLRNRSLRYGTRHWSRETLKEAS